MHYYSLLAVAFLAVSDLVAGHGAIVSATGDQGGTGSAIGSKPPHIDYSQKQTFANQLLSRPCHTP